LLVSLLWYPLWRRPTSSSVDTLVRRFLTELRVRMSGHAVALLMVSSAFCMRKERLLSLILPLSFTVGAETVALPRTKGPDNRTSHFEFLRSDGSRKYSAMIAHTIPTSVLGVQSRVFSLRAQDYDTSGVDGRGHSVHIVWKHWGGSPVNTDMNNLHTSFLANLSASASTNYFAIQAGEV